MDSPPRLPDRPAGPRWHKGAALALGAGLCLASLAAGDAGEALGAPWWLGVLVGVAAAAGVWFGLRRAVPWLAPLTMWAITGVAVGLVVGVAVFVASLSQCAEC